MRKRWHIAQPVSGELKNLFPELSPLMVQLLANRELTEEDQIEQFLHPDYDDDTHDPFLFKDMQKSVERIFTAIESGEQITVHGDYDADGVCASSLLVGVLRDLGAKVDVYLPHREKEGYGVNKNTIEFLLERGTNLIITVDCGTANVEPVAYAQEKGIDVIVTDHHHVPEETSPAFALINPQNGDDTYPFGYLCGTGVAFKLAQALFYTDQKKDKPKLAPGYDKWLLDLVAIATIADMMPLKDENRALVKYGLIVLKKTRRVGLRRLMEGAGVWPYGEERDVTPFDIGFVIAPRLNAAGRMDHANAAYELLMTTDENESVPLIENIETNNNDRRALTERIYDEIMGKVEADARVQGDRYLIFAYGEGWPIGIAGLVASRVLNKTGMPVIVATRLEDRIAGSGRSVPGFDMAAALEEMADLFETSGGHAAACGFSLKQGGSINEVQKIFEDKAREALEGQDLRPLLPVDMEISAKEVTWKTFDLVSQLAPYGKGNHEPTFVTRDLEVEEVRFVGNEEKHLKLRLRDPKLFKSISAIGFNLGEEGRNLRPGSIVDVAYTLSSNEWNGNRELQLKLEDIDSREETLII